MKYIGQKSLLTLFFIGIIAASCSKDSQNQYGDDMTYLPISDLVIHPLGDVAHVSYTSETEWTVDADANWIHFSSDKGVPGTTTLKITVDPNIDIDRDAVITFWSGSKAMDSFIVTQKKAVLDISQKKFDLGWKKKDQNFTVESNIQWEIQLNGEKKDKFDVISHEIDKVAGKIEKDFRPSKEVVTFGPKANNLSEEEDEVEITIVPVLLNGSGDKFELGKDVKETLTTTISIYQDYLIFLINDSRDSVTLDGFSELGKTYVEEGKVNKDKHLCSQEFTVVSEVEWKYDESALGDVGGRLEEVAVTDTEKYGRDAKVYTMVLHMDEPNTTRKEREHDLKLWAVDDVEASRTVKVVQNAYVLSFDADSVSFKNVGGENTLNVNTTGPWKIKDMPEWLTVEPFEGVDTCEVTIKAPERNLNFNNLTKTLRLTSLVPEVYSDLLARQDAFIFEVEEDKALRQMSRLDKNNYKVKIHSSGPWELALDGGSWLEISGIQLKDGRYYCDHGCDTTIVIKATESNPYSEDRDMTCLIRSTLHKDLGEENNGRYVFGIKQESFRFEILTAIDDDDDFSPQSFASYRSGENTQSFYLKCSARWMITSKGITSDGITSDVDWLTFDPKEGSGEQYCTLSMIADTNAGKENRSAIVTISADINEDGVYGDDEKTFVVHQDGFVFDVNSSEGDDHIFEPWKAEEVRVDVNTIDGAGWEVESEYDYVKINDKDGEGNSYFTFAPKDNGDLQNDRDVTVTITSKVSKETKTITYTQNNYDFDIKKETLTPFDEISSNNENKEVKVTCSGPWALEDVPDWLEVKKDKIEVTEGTGNATLLFKTVMNNLSTTAENKATVKVVSEVGGKIHKKEVEVSQKKYTWQVSGMGGQTLPYDELDKQDHEISVTSSGKWKLSFDKEKDDDFFTLDKEEGGPSKSSSTNIKLTVKENYTTVPREVTITLKSEHVGQNDSLKDKLIVKQKAYVYNVPTEDIKFDANGGTKDYVATCSGKLDARSNEDWLQVNIEEEKLLVEVKPNTDKKNRTGTITIQSEHASENSALKTTITVTQEAKKKK